MIRLCINCQQRPARFFRKKTKRWKADKDHKLCSKCFRDLKNAVIAKEKKEVVVSA